MTERPIIPVLEPEVLLARLSRSPEPASTKVAKMRHLGIAMGSYRKVAREFDVMMDILERFQYRHAIVAIGCMPPGWRFALSIKPGYKMTQMAIIAGAFEQACLMCNGGHDGIVVAVGSTFIKKVEPWWEIEPAERR